MAANFALTPALAVQGVIDMSSSEGIKLYRDGAKALDEKEPFSCNPTDLYRALKAIEMRAEEYGWKQPMSGILWIPRDLDDMDDCDLITQSHGMISFEAIKAYEESYLGTETREAQDNHMMYQSIIKSLSKAAKNKIELRKKEYVIDGTPSANLLIKVLVREYHLDTNATVSTIRANLSRLDKYIVEIGYDIGKFNDYVRANIKELEARGEEQNDIIDQLFRGYANAKDAQFRSYMQTKKDLHDEATGAPPFTYEMLMTLSENKFKTMCLEKTWNAPSEHDKQLVALKAEIKRLESKRAPGNKAGNKTTQKPREEKRKERTRAKKPDWLEKHQKPDDANETREWKRNTYYWCCEENQGKCGGKWRVHKPTECKGTSFMKKKGEENETKRLKLENAYATVAEEYSSDEMSIDEEEKKE